MSAPLNDHTEPSEFSESKSIPPTWLMEKLAAIEHERWSDWQAWCHKVLREQLNPNGVNNDLEDVLKRWDKQIATPYDKLSEQEKWSDREQVMRYWPLIQEWVTTAAKNSPETTTKDVKNAPDNREETP